MSAAHPLVGVDLNLLVYLDLLLQERSVTRAAERAGITQSAMSRALQRLRDRLGDKILVQVGRGMEVTEHASSLHGALSDVLSRIHNEVLTPQVFAPAESTRRFALATSESIDSALVPKLVAHLSKEAPGIDLTVSEVSSGSRSDLDDARLDAMIGVSAGARPSLHSRTLVTDRFVALARKGHPGVKKKKGLSLSRFVAYPHVVVASEARSGGEVERALAEVGRTRRVAVKAESYARAAEYVEASDYFLTAPEKLARRLARERRLTVTELPVIVPEMSFALVWHARNDRDPGHRWLREQIVDLAGGV